MHACMNLNNYDRTLILICTFKCDSFDLFSDHDVTISDMGLSKSDYEYLRENNPVNPVELDLHTAELHDEPIPSLSSGNVQNALNQNHCVQSSVESTSQTFIVENKENTNTVPVTNTNSILLTSPVNGAAGSLSSALQGLNLVSSCSVPLSDGTSELLQGPSQIIGHTNNIDPSVLKALQIIEPNNAMPLQVPVEVGENSEIHILTVAVDDDNGPIATTANTQEGNDLNTLENESPERIHFEEPRKTSTPLRPNAFDETILAGNIDCAKKK